MNLKNVELLRLQTSYMKQDPTTMAMSEALTPKFREIASEVKKCLLLPRIDELDEAILDELAWEMKIDWYDAIADIEIKRQLIKTAPDIKAHLGTPYAVEKVIEVYFGDGYVQEWFDYAGIAGMFKVITNNTSVTGDKADLFTKVIEKVKRKSQHLEEIIIELTGEMNLYTGFVLQTGDFYTVEQVV